MTRFARRAAWDLTPNLLAREQEQLRGAGIPLLDLTVSNPTQCGLSYPPEIATALADPRALRYEPSPTGLREAREVVAAWYEDGGIPVDPDRIILTASTSEAYGFLFRVLADPGDDLLVPQPSYPLFQYLADLHDLGVTPYPLRYDTRWRVDLGALRRAVTARTRALVLVHPNNPTGSCLTRQERAQIAPWCHSRGLPLIVDEVFGPYRFGEGPELAETFAGASEPLTFVLDGLSKRLGLPQMKLSWIVVSGPPALVEQALARLEVVADTYLSVNTPAQFALRRWADLAPVIQAGIRERILANRQWFIERCADGPVQMLEADGGWSAVLRVPGVEDDEAWALALLAQDHVVVHPGYFFDFEQPGSVVVGLLTPPAVFREGISRLLQRGRARGLEQAPQGMVR